MIVSNLYRILCSTSNMFSFDIWNYYYSELCLPITLLIVFQLIVGVLGSVTVLFLYQKRLKSKWHKSRFFFISILGTLDFICVSFQIDDVYHKLQLTHFVTFPSSWSCYSFLIHNFSNCYGLYNDNDSDCSNQTYLICQIMKCQITTSRLQIFICVYRDTLFYLLLSIFPRFLFLKLLKFSNKTSLGKCVRKSITQPER